MINSKAALSNTFYSSQSDAFVEIQVEDKSSKKSNKAHHDSGNEPAEKFIKKDSQLKLNCYLRKATEKHLYIFW